MTKREFFGLDFYRIKDAFGRVDNICKREVVGNFSGLQILSSLSKSEVDYFIEEIDRALDKGIYPEVFLYSDGIDSDEVKIVPPNMVINGTCTISLVDMKSLLLEWKSFVSI